MTSFHDSLEDSIPGDHSRQVASAYHLDALFEEGNSIKTVMDLGCGAGNSIDMFREKDSGIRWIGLDIESSPEGAFRTRDDGEFYAYDGIHIPFDHDYFDLIYSNQVFEHVRDPRGLLKEVARVLRPRGHLIGSTSQLEPYHSYSLWNFTPYGFSLLVREAGLELLELRPSIDGLTLIIRRGLGRPRFLRAFWAIESPLNAIIGIVGKILRKTHVDINRIKLLYCGQFCFVVRKPDAPQLLGRD